MIFFQGANTMGNYGWDYDGFNSGGTPSYNPGSSGGGINWGNVINQGFGLASQAFSAWGRNPTQQIGNSSVIGIGQGYSPAAQLQAQAQLQQAIAAQNASNQNAFNSQTPGGRNSLDSIFGNLTQTVSDNPMIFAAGALGLYLLMREPPKSRR